MMRIHRLLATALVLFGAATLFAQDTPPPGRGGRGQRGGGGGGRRGFPQATRELASQDVLARGKGLYDTNCASCHAPDFRGPDKGTRLLRSQASLNDQHGELIGRRLRSISRN